MAHKIEAVEVKDVEQAKYGPDERAMDELEAVCPLDDDERREDDAWRLDKTEAAGLTFWSLTRGPERLELSAILEELGYEITPIRYRDRVVERVVYVNGRVPNGGD